MKRKMKKTSKTSLKRFAAGVSSLCHHLLNNQMFKDKIHYVTTDIEVAKKLRKEGHIPVVDGIIPGVTGGLLAHAPLTEQEVTALLVPSSQIFPDPDAGTR